jgi:hypothetical protein
MVRVTVGLFQRGNKGINVVQVNVVIVYQVDKLFEGSSFQPGEGIMQFRLFIGEFSRAVDESEPEEGDE